MFSVMSLFFPTSPIHQKTMYGRVKKQQKEKLEKLRAPSDAETALTEAVIYETLQAFVMSEHRLMMFGYPMPHPTDPTRVVIPDGFHPPTPSYFQSNQRNCSRCKVMFQVRDDGTPVIKQRCHYHKGIFRRSERTGLEEYACCNNKISSLGCRVSEGHVVDGSGHPDYAKGYVMTDLSFSDGKATPGIFALDCEMCDTTIGPEVTKVTLVNHNMEVMYESLVKPANPILDYNTPYSGLKAGDLNNVSVTMQSAREKILGIVDSQSILIGHSLKHDLKVLKIMHRKIIDTEDVFPHDRGIPFTKSLRRIVNEEFKVNIQGHDMKHDSKEDAIFCMKLMLKKVKQIKSPFIQ